MFRGCKQRKSTREGFQGVQGIFERYLRKSFPCKNPMKNKEKPKNYSTGEPHMSFHICCTYPLIYRMQPSTPSCPGNLTNHSPHTMQKEHRFGEETTESAIVLQTLCYAYAMLCYVHRTEVGARTQAFCGHPEPQTEGPK